MKLEKELAEVKTKIGRITIYRNTSAILLGSCCLTQPFITGETISNPNPIYIGFTVVNAIAIGASGYFFVDNQKELNHLQKEQKKLKLIKKIKKTLY